MLNIVLHQPQIPNNTGAIGRLCVNLGANLHLIKPLGFDISQKAVRRAGLDYWAKLNPSIYENLEAFRSAHPNANTFYATTKVEYPYFNASFTLDDYIFFGSETSGLPSEMLEANKSRCITIPMSKEGRSLNLAMSVGIVAYEALRQNYHLLPNDF